MTKKSFGPSSQNLMSLCFSLFLFVSWRCEPLQSGASPSLLISPARCPCPRARTQPLTSAHIVPHNRFQARDSQSSAHWLPPEQLTTTGFRFPGLRWLPLPCGGGYLASCCLRVILEVFKKVMKTGQKNASAQQEAPKRDLFLVWSHPAIVGAFPRPPLRSMDGW